MKRRKYCQKHVQLFIDKEAGEQPIMETISDVMKKPRYTVKKGYAILPDRRLAAFTPIPQEEEITKKSLKDHILGFIFTVQDESNR
ncbi:MAG TPA: hypothetical protein VF941_02935 [Clostridia bacterium]